MMKSSVPEGSAESVQVNVGMPLVVVGGAGSRHSLDGGDVLETQDVSQQRPIRAAHGGSDRVVEGAERRGLGAYCVLEQGRVLDGDPLVAD